MILLFQYRPSLSFQRRIYEKQQLLLKQWDQLQPIPESNDVKKKDDFNRIKPSSKLEKEIEEEKRLRKQKKLTVI